MGAVFGDVVAEWTAFYAFTGGSAAKLLGLLFVAVSLRLDLFHRREVTDVRDFAAFAFVSLLGAMVVAGAPLPRASGGVRWPGRSRPLGSEGCWSVPASSASRRA